MTRPADPGDGHEHLGVIQYELCTDYLATYRCVQCGLIWQVAVSVLTSAATR